MNYTYLPKEAALALKEVITQWKQGKPDIEARCFCGGKLTVSINQIGIKTFATVTRKNTLIGHGESYALRKELNLPAGFGQIWKMIGDVLWPENIEIIALKPRKR